MTFTLHVDAERWRRHVASVVAELPDLVPVAKGNGYGLGVARLGAEAARLGVDTVAVGVVEEVAPVRAVFDGSILVLTPYHPALDSAASSDAMDDPHVIRTVSHLDALRGLANGPGRPRIVLEVRTSMLRHGIDAQDAREVAPLLDQVTCEGIALHLPLAGSHLAECEELLADLRSAGLAFGAVWVSHLRAAEVQALAAATSAPVRPRVGTRLWLGDRGALRVTGTVLDVHPLARGDRYGYRQRRGLAAGHLVVVSGGTAHGVGLEAPRAARGLLSRGQRAAIGGLDAAGLALSPFHVAGRRRWFAEPPHMQVSMLLLPARVRAPAIGDELDCDARMTTACFDRVVFDGADGST